MLVSLQHLTRRRDGFTLAEIIITACIALAGIGAAMTLNTAHLRLVKSSRQSNAATLALQERVEQMRLGDWRKITDAAYLKDVLLANSTKSAAPLDGMVERVTVSAYPDPSVAGRMVVERGANGQCSVVEAGEGLTTQRLAQVELQVIWSGTDKRPRMRATTTVISNGGISRMNLPGMGIAGNTFPNDVFDPEDPSSDPEPDSGSDPDPDPDPETEPEPETEHGKGKGRGNVGGKPGQG